MVQARVESEFQACQARLGEALEAKYDAQFAIEDARMEAKWARDRAAYEKRRRRLRAEDAARKAEYEKEQAARWAGEDALVQAEIEAERETRAVEREKHAARWEEIDALLRRLECRETRRRLEADAEKVWGSVSGSSSCAAEPKVISLVGMSAEDVREVACARGVHVGVEYNLTGCPGSLTLQQSIAMDM